jgi:hypothetical protein
MSIRLLILSLLFLALAAAGCGSSGSSSSTTHPIGHTNAESGTQAYGGFPGAGNPHAPDVTTTPGAPPKPSSGKAGGGSSATCIGC